MNMRDLGYFLVMADAGQLAIAATRIGVTQPALTKSLNRLELTVGSPLFLRTRKEGLVPTQAGKLLLTRGKLLLAMTENLDRELAEFAAGNNGHLRVGAGPTMAEYLLPDATRTLLALAPNVTIKIITALNDALFEQLRNGDVDFVVSGLPELAPEDFQQLLLMHDEMLVVSSRNHPLAQKRKVSLADLSKSRWILAPPKVIARQWIEQRFAENGLPPPRVSVEADSAMAIMAVLSDSQLIGFHPKLNIRAWGHHRKLAVINAPDAIWRRPIGITWRKDQYLPPAAHQFMKLLDLSARKLQP